LNGAAQAQAQGIVALRALTREDAETAQALALTRLAEALALVQELAKQQAREQVQQQRAQLKKAYERLAREEAQLRAATAELAALPELNRRHRAQLNELAAAQSRIRQETADLRSNVADTLLFDHLHGRIDDKAAQVSSALQQSDVGERVLADEAYIAGALATMAQALEEAQRSEDFATSSGGGDGSGGGAQPPLIPPVAELKLLRGLQENVYQRTRAAGGDGDRPVETETLLELAGEQRELPMLAERLIEKLQAANPQPEVVPAPQIPQE
jgi:DNA repair exonuclease SbcCD ATPase subunit